jgi:hypothetical protein
MRVALALIACLLVGAARPADERTRLRPCSSDAGVPAPPGEVVRLFELHKDRNPQNVLVIHTYADADCRALGGAGDKRRLVDMYWRMNSGTPDECYKPTHPRIKQETLRNLAVRSLSPDRTRFALEIAPLDEVDHDIPDREAHIRLHQSRGGCRAEVRVRLGSGEVLRLEEIRAKGEYALGIPQRGVEQLELVGLDPHNRRIHRVYRARGDG